VVDQQDVQFAAARDHALQVLAWRDRRRGIVRIVEVQNPRALQDVCGDFVYLEQEVRARAQRVEIRLGLRQQRPADVRQVARFRQDGKVAPLQVGEREVNDPLL